MVNTKNKRKYIKKVKAFDEIYYVLMFQIVLMVIILFISVLANNNNLSISKENNKLKEYINEEIELENYKNIISNTKTLFMEIKEKIYNLYFFDNLQIKNNEIAAPVNGIITSNFGNRLNPITKKLEFHKGVDIAANEGDDIFAVTAGEIIEINENDSYGKYIVVESDNDIIFKYCHCSEIIGSINNYVDSGEVIAKIGSTGISTGPHLHLEFIKNSKNYNPLSILGELYEV